MRTPLLVVLLSLSILWGLQSRGSSAGQKEAGADVAPASADPIEVTIATGGGLYGPVKTQFKVGEEIPVVVSLNNTGDNPAKYCLSTTIFQNRPLLKRDGQPVPYLTVLPARTEKEDAIELCERRAVKQVYVLKPKQKRVVDWLTIGPRGIAWYNPLPPGHYEMVLMRRVECCQGPMVESNKVAFDIVQ